MSLKESLEILHKDNRKQRSWDFSEVGIASKIRDLLENNFPHYLYESASEGLFDVKEGKSFEVDVTQFRQKGGTDMIGNVIPCSYFKQEGYEQIVSFIEKEYNKINRI